MKSNNSNRKEKKGNGMSFYALIDKMDESIKLLSSEDKKNMQELYKMVRKTNGVLFINNKV